MIFISLISKCVQYATKKHEGQKDKAGEDYILHPLTVALSLSNDDEKIVAILHDTLEDTNATVEELYNLGITEVCVNAIETLTKSNKDSYMEYISKIAKNELARSVKLADLKHNMDLLRLPNITAKDEKRKQKYVEAYNYLLTNEPEHHIHLSISSAGWCKLEIDNFVGYGSYLNEIPLDILKATKRYYQDGCLTEVFFDEEGTEFTVVPNYDYVSIVCEREHDEVYKYNIPADELYDTLVSDIKNSIDETVAFFLAEDKTKLKEEMTNIINDIKILKHVRNERNRDER